MKATIRLLALAQHDTLATTHDRSPDDHRQLAVVELVADDGVVGFGECSALNQAGYTHEWAAGAYRVLSEQRLEVSADEQPMAAAAVEMAWLDLDLRRRDESLADHLIPGGARSVTAGAVVALGSTADTLAACTRLVDDGFTRIKLKISPDDPTDRIEAVRRAMPDTELQLDANGSFGPRGLDRLMDEAEHGISAIEQPFDPDDPGSAKKLVKRLRSSGLDTLVVADESATDLTRVRKLLRRRAATAISIKPPRVGGLRRALDIHDWCRADGVPVTAGGMVESGLGRHALAAVALLHGFALTGDVSPARRWLAEDPWPDLVMAGGAVHLPDTPGVAPLPDRELLDHCTLESATLELG